MVRVDSLSGPLALDEATEFCKNIANTNPAAAAFALFPIVHQSTDRAAVVLNRRAIEDKLMTRLAS